jgi:hypothetical protein
VRDDYDGQSNLRFGKDYRHQPRQNALAMISGIHCTVSMPAQVGKKNQEVKLTLARMPKVSRAELNP